MGRAPKRTLVGGPADGARTGCRAIFLYADAKGNVDTTSFPGGELYRCEGERLRHVEGELGRCLGCGAFVTREGSGNRCPLCGGSVPA